MTTNEHRESATIYTFPPRGRFAAAAPERAPSATSKPTVTISTGEAWYHEEAIRGAEHPHKNN